MKGEIIIHYYLPNNLKIICREKSNIKKQKNQRPSLKKLQCNYRVLQKIQPIDYQCAYKQINIPTVVLNKNILTSHCKKYIAAFPDYSHSGLNFIQTNLQSNDTHNSKNQQNSSQQITNKKKQHKLQILNDPIAMDLLNEYRELCSHNIMKNIKQGFIRSFTSNEGAQNKEYYENLVEHKVTYTSMKRKILSYKNLPRDNKVIKQLCKNQHMNIIFKDFLLNAENGWLQNSKIMFKDQCLGMVKFLLKIIDQIQYIDVIESYNKK